MSRRGTIKYTTLLKFYIIVMFFIGYHAFRLIEIPHPLSTIWSTDGFPVLLVLVTILITLLVINHNKKAISQQKIFFRYFVAMLLSLFIISTYSMIVYDGQHLKNVLAIWSDYLLVLCSVPMFEYIIRKNDVELFDLLNMLATIYMILIFIQHIIFNMGGGPFLYGIGLGNIRNGSVRIPSGSFGGFAAIYTFDKIYRKKYKHFFLNLFCLAIDIYDIVFVTQTRVSIVVCIICMLVSILIYGTNISKLLKSFILITCAALLLYSTGAFDFFISTFSDKSYSDNVARFGAYAYYWKSFIKNPIFAQGFITNLQYANIKYGPFLNYYYVDVGFIGLLAQTGIFSIVLLVWPMIRWGKICIRIFLNSIERQRYGFYIVLFVYLMTTLVSLSILDTGRSFLFPLYFAVFGAYEYQHKNNQITL